MAKTHERFCRWADIGRPNSNAYREWVDSLVLGPCMGVLEVTHWGTGIILCDVIARYQESSEYSVLNPVVRRWLDIRSTQEITKLLP